VSGETFRLPVEAGHVALFQRAIGAGEPDFARLAQGCTVPALTFVQAADHFDPDFRRRPRHAEPWFGSGATPSGAEVASDEEQGLFHTDQLFTYHRHPRIGEELLVDRLEPRRWTKQGRRGGELEFIERVTEFRDASRQAVVTACWRDVRTQRRHSEVSKAQSAEPDDSVEEPAGERSVLAENISRTQLVMYAGVSGDFHPLHHDETYVRYLGYPTVFVPGMLTMAMVGRAVGEHVETPDVCEFGGRFHAQVWPGDCLYAYTRESDKAAADMRRIDVIALNQDGRRVFTAHALARS
jgi:acyl dehydratase